MSESRRLSTFVLFTTLGGMLALALPGGCSSSSSPPTTSADSGTDSFSEAAPDADSVGTPCTATSDCPASTNPCMVAVCAAGACTDAPLPNGQAAAKQTQGDCQKIVCDGSGGTKSVDDPTDLPKTTTVCMVPSCSGTPLAPSTTPAATGTNCTADGMSPKIVCGDTSDSTVKGTCVECNTNADCFAANDAGVANCSNHTCQ